MYKRTLFQSFKLAWEGISFIFRTERNMKIHCMFALMAVVCSFAFRVTAIEFIFVIFSIALVLITEAANTAFELLLDFVHGDRYHPDVKLLKDIIAGGVFIAATNAFVIGIIIFIPKILGLAKVLCRL
ncbi:MAG: diacylglycerol kinase family protein [Candidatus Omnitrophica bacterium]|nr:diacylglycerol kinase family protein [Candidatus Omnitrophota bacterium]